MSTSVADLTGVRAKLWRAEEHRRSLIAEWNLWCNQPANLRVCYIRRDGPWYVVTIQPLPQPDIRFSIIAGDIIHNLRCALDHLVYQLVLRDGHKPTRRNEFPIYESEEGFRNEVKSRKRNPEAGVLFGITIDGDAWAIIEKAQPYLSSPQKSLLAVIGHLSNMDKHRTLCSQISFVGYEAIKHAVGWSHEAILREQRVGAGVLSSEKETEIVRFRFADYPDPKVRMIDKFQIDPTFGEGEIKGGFQVGLGLFRSLIDTVTEITDEISKLPRVVDIPPR